MKVDRPINCKHKATGRSLMMSSPLANGEMPSVLTNQYLYLKRMSSERRRNPRANGTADLVLTILYGNCLLSALLATINYAGGTGRTIMPSDMSGTCQTRLHGTLEAL